MFWRLVYIKNILFSDSDCCFELSLYFHHVFPAPFPHEAPSLPLQCTSSDMDTHGLDDHIVQARSLLRVNGGIITGTVQENQVVWSSYLRTYLGPFGIYTKKQHSDILIKPLPDHSLEYRTSLFPAAQTQFPFWYYFHHHISLHIC